MKECKNCDSKFSRSDSLKRHQYYSSKIENNAGEESQQSLLEAGDESQIVCGQLTINHSDDDKNNAREERQQSLLEADDGSESPLANRKRKFLNTERFTQLADLKTKRKIAPIKKWIELNEGESYRINAIHEIEVTIDEKKQISHYADLFNEEMKLMPTSSSAAYLQDMQPCALLPRNSEMRGLSFEVF